MKFTTRKVGDIEKPGPDDLAEKKVAEELRRRYKQWDTLDNEFLRRSDFELDFISNHWLEEETRVDRRKDMLSRGRSAFSIDLLTPSMDVVINQARVNKVTVNFLPVSGEDVSEATAQVRQGIYRDMERVSRGFIVRETAFQFAVSVGRGYERVTVEEEEGASFLRRIGLQRIVNLHSVAFDLGGIDFNYMDMSWAYFWEDMDRDEYRVLYGTPDGDDTGEQPLEIDTAGLSLEEVDRAIWFPNGKVRYGDYFRKRFGMRRVVEYQDPAAELQSCWEDEYDPSMGPLTGQYKDKLDWVVEWRRMSGTQTLQKMVWFGRYIPLVVYVGREQFRGKEQRIHTGLIRPAIDPSRIHDAMFSRMVDEVGFSPLPYFQSAVGQLGVEQKRIISDINRNAWSTVEYTPKPDAEGRQLPEPHWVMASTNAGAVVQAAELAANKLDRVLSVYAPQRGQQMGDMSGKAMRELKDQGDLSHAAFGDNYERAISCEAIIVNDLMDNVLTRPQLITALDGDSQSKQVLINKVFTDPVTGKQVKHVFGGNNKYAPVAQIGSAYPSQMAQASAQLLELAKTFPAQMAPLIDLILKGLNVPNWQAMSERMGFNKKDGEQSAEQLMQENKQLQQLNDQAHELIQKLVAKVNEMGSGQFLKRLEIASRERIASGNNLTTLAAAELKAGHEASLEVLLKQLEVVVSAMSTSEDQVEQSQLKTAQPTGETA